MGASIVKSQRKALIGRKVGMTQVFQDDVVVPVTVLEVGPCTVLQVKSAGSDGYSSLQLGFADTSKSLAKPQVGHFSKAGGGAKRSVREVPSIDASDVYRVPLVSEAGGTVAYQDFEVGENILERRVAKSKIIQRIVLTGASEGDGDDAEAEAPEEGGDEAAGDGGEAAEASAAPAAKQPTVLIKDSSGKVLKEYALPRGASVEVQDGATISDGDVIAYVRPEDGVEEVSAGMQLGLNLFEEATLVDVTGITKGRGFAGCIKRHGFASGDKSHGSKNVREPGSTGMHTDPGRVFKGKKMPGQFGNKPRKARNVQVVEVDTVANLLLVKGSVPGPSGGYVMVQESLKKT